MTSDSTSLPLGAGATTSGGDSAGYRSEEWRESSPSTHREIELVETRPSAAVVAGAALAGALVGAAVPFMFAGRGSSSSSGRSESTTVEESVIINRPPHQIYDFWRDFENLPQFMDNIESVTKLNEV
ncbi:MAG TPA: SRPBCC family protein, partial [Allosphingosinicella sp.]